MKEILNLCVRGNVIDAYQYLQNLKHKTEEHIKLEAAFYKRFFKEPPDLKKEHEDSWIEKVINAYQRYFIDVLTERRTTADAEGQLLLLLNSVLPSTCKDIDEAETELSQVFKQKGYYFLGGKTLPHYGPYIWKATHTVKYEVELPNGMELVDVHFMDDFLMLSWLHFATFGHLSTSGWANDTGLYCVRERYEHLLDRPEFQISFLKHEAQHVQDYKHFPNLEPKGLEYRAKLIELYDYPDFEMMRKICREANPLEGNPHSFSSYLILKEYSNHFFKQDIVQQMDKWEMLDLGDIQQFAKKLFDEHTKQLQNAADCKLNQVDSSL